MRFWISILEALAQYVPDLFEDGCGENDTIFL